MNEYSSIIDLNKKRFTRLTFFFWVSIVCILLILVFPKGASYQETPMMPLIILTFLISNFIFACYLSNLANASNKVWILWFLGSAILPPFTTFIAYYRMKVIATKNDWA